VQIEKCSVLPISWQHLYPCHLLLSKCFLVAENYTLIEFGIKSIRFQNSVCTIFVWHKKVVLSSDAISGWVGWALAHQEFGSSVNTIPATGGRLCSPHYCLPTRIWKPNGISAFFSSNFSWCQLLRYCSVLNRQPCMFIQDTRVCWKYHFFVSNKDRANTVLKMNGL